MKKVVSVFAALALFLSGLNAYAADTVSYIAGNNNTVVFVDVTEQYNWAEEAISYFAGEGIVNGVGNNKFAPGATVTREQFAKMLVLTFDAPLESPEEATFSDVLKTSWSYPYIEVCKDFLTGYANPFKGKPSFHPTEAATREDIAVALVKMMGLTPNDCQDPYYASGMFSDYNEISSGLRGYVNVAAERGLINGYGNGTFGPQRSISRAETVVLLSRSMKQAVGDISAELEIGASVIKGTDPKNITLSITAEEGTKVTVDGEPVEMENLGNGKIKGMYAYQFAEEGDKTFTVVGTKPGKQKSLQVTASYRVDAPVITVTACPTTSNEKTVTISGTVKDTDDRYPKLTVNGRLVPVMYNGAWSESVSLTEGNNTITLVATNESGKSTTVTKTITFGVGAPVITITVCPETSNEKTATISGTVKDTNDRDPKLTVNGKQVPVLYNGTWSESVGLTEGNNIITIIATNDLGKSTTVTKTITFGVGAPVITVTVCPATSNEKTVTISGTVKDTNDRYPKLTVNGRQVSVSYNGAWSESVDLTDGSNTVTILATNDLGKSTTVTKTITFTAEAPQLVFTNCPDVTNQQNITIQGRITGNTDGVKLYINDEEVFVSYDKSFSESVTLTEGANGFVFRAVNGYNKSVSAVKTITYTTIQPPVLTVNELAGAATEQTITVSGTVSDGLDAAVEVFVNEAKVSSTAGNWSTSVTLHEGVNSIIIVAANKYGKTATTVKTVTYTPAAPVEQPAA